MLSYLELGFGKEENSQKFLATLGILDKEFHIRNQLHRCGAGWKSGKGTLRQSRYEDCRKHVHRQANRDGGGFCWSMRKGAEGESRLRTAASSEKRGQIWVCVGRVQGTHSRRPAPGQVSLGDPLVDHQRGQSHSWYWMKNGRGCEQLRLTGLWWSEDRP